MYFLAHRPKRDVKTNEMLIFFKKIFASIIPWKIENFEILLTY